MARRTFLLFACTLLLVLMAYLSSSAHQSSGVKSQFKSPLGLFVDQKGERAFVALQSADAVAVVDLQAGKVLRELAVGKRPSDLVRLQGILYVFCEEGREVVALDPDKLTVLRRMSAKEAPSEALVRREERQISDEDANFLLGQGEATNLRAVVRHGLVLFIALQRPRNRVPATQISQGWVFTNAIGSLINRPPYLATLDEPQQGYADPSDLVAFADQLFIACAGADHVLIADRERLLKAGGLPNLQSGYPEDRPSHREDLTTSRQFIVAKLPTQANPRRLALSGDGKTLVVSNHLADSLTVIDAMNLKVLRHISLNGPPPNAARRGEILFNSGKMTFQGQFTCASCHPNGGSDGLPWDLERDGVGNFKRTKSLLGVKDTAPYGWQGSSPTLADRVTGTLRTLHRHEPAGIEVADLVAYLETLESPKPLPVKENDLPAVERGKKIFQGKGLCTNCHGRIGLDDGKSHDVGTRGPTDTQDRFDTPSLRGLSHTRRYLHDGRANTLRSIFTYHNSRQRHGAAHLLSEEELLDLIAYLWSL